jgi:hypothetical protein
MKNFCLAFALMAITNASLELGVWNLGKLITCQHIMYVILLVTEQLQICDSENLHIMLDKNQ